MSLAGDGKVGRCYELGLPHGKLLGHHAVTISEVAHVCGKV